MRLIDADVLIKSFSGGESMKSISESIHDQRFVDALREAPTVDAVEVVHGHWEETLVPDGYVQKASRLRKRCSVCGWTNACRYKYCPNCGAAMDGVRDEKSAVIAYLLEQIGDVEEAIMVGDTKFDVIGANAHNIPTIGVSWGYGEVADMEKAGAIAIAHSMDELVELLNQS